MDTEKNTCVETPAATAAPANPPVAATPAELGVELAVAVSRLRARMRSEAGDPGHGVTVSQIAMMRRLAACGSMTVSQLADAEHVSQQAISQRLDLLAPTGYLSLAPDETDRRRKLVTLTEKGRAYLASLAAGDEEWLSQAISAVVDRSELATLAASIDLLDRLASVDLRSRGNLR